MIETATSFRTALEFARPPLLDVASLKPDNYNEISHINSVLDFMKIFGIGQDYIEYYGPFRIVDWSPEFRDLYEEAEFWHDGLIEVGQTFQELPAKEEE